jgi:hypothetical protein
MAIKVVFQQFTHQRMGDTEQGHFILTAVTDGWQIITRRHENIPVRRVQLQGEIVSWHVRIYLISLAVAQCEIGVANPFRI